MTDQARFILKSLWIAACNADGVDPKAQFVIFSPDNKYAKMLNAYSLKAMGDAVRLSAN